MAWEYVSKEWLDVEFGHLYISSGFLKFDVRSWILLNFCNSLSFNFSCLSFETHLIN